MANNKTPPTTPKSMKIQAYNLLHIATICTPKRLTFQSFNLVNITCTHIRVHVRT